MARQRRGGFDYDRQWHLDKRVPISLIIAILIQSASAFWWASGVTRDVQNLQISTRELAAENKERVKRIDELGQLQTEFRYMRESLARVEKALEKIVDVRHTMNDAPAVPKPGTR